MRTQMPFTLLKPSSQKHWAVRKLPGMARAAECEFGGHCCADAPGALATSKTAAQPIGDLKNRSIVFLSAMPLNLVGLRCGGYRIAGSAGRIDGAIAHRQRLCRMVRDVPRCTAPRLLLW
jgi:hypothetical protein